MKYWPVSGVTPHLHHSHAWEIMCAFSAVRMSEGTMIACGQAVRRVRASEGPLYVIESVGAPMRLAYYDYPEFEDWMKLERAGFIANGTFFGLTIAALH